MKKRMQILTIWIALSMAYSFTTVNYAPNRVIERSLPTDYCDGWEDGYCEGWKDVKAQYAVCPVTPVCPVAKVECSEGYKCGYNRGFKAGMKAAKKD
jgi:hypothetical protein